MEAEDEANNVKAEKRQVMNNCMCTCEVINSLLSIVTIAPLVRGDDCKERGRTESTAKGMMGAESEWDGCIYCAL